MFANNELPSFPQRLNRPSKQEDSLGTVQGAQSDSCKTRNDTAFDHAFQGQSRSAPAQVRMARKQDVKKPTDQVDEEKGEERDALLPRLAPVRIPTMGTKWEYYSGAPMPHGPHSPVGRRDSGEATEGPEAEKHGSPAERQFLPSTKSLTSSLSTGSNYSRTSQAGLKRKRSLPGTPDPSAEVIALSPKALLATNRFICEICNKGFQRDQNLQLHRRGHNVPWKLRARPPSNSSGKRVYVCPEPSCVHHDPRRALGDLTGIKKHYSRKHGEKRWKCEKCGKKYAVEADWKAHTKTCGPKQYTCDCGNVFARRETYATHRACCKHVSDGIQAQARSQASAFAPVSAAHPFPHFQLPPVGNLSGRPILPRRLPPPAPLFTARPNPPTVAHIGQSHDGTPLLISMPARVSGSGQPGMMADINLAARRGGEHREPLQLLPMSGPMWGQRGLGNPPLAASGTLQPPLNLWLGSGPRSGGIQPTQPLQPLAIPGRNGAVKLELGGNGFGDSQGAMASNPPSPLTLGFSEAFPNPTLGQQAMMAPPNVQATSPPVQPLPLSPRPQSAADQDASALPSAAAAAAAVAAANAGHQVTIEVNPAQGLTMPPDLPSPREQPEGGGYKVLEQPPVVVTLSSSGAPLISANPEAPVPTLIQVSPAALQGGGELPGMGMMEQQGQGGGLLIAAAQGASQATLLSAQRPKSPMLVGTGQVVGTQEEVLWAKVPTDEQKAQHAAQQAQAQAQQAMQQQMAAQQQQQQQAQQQGLQMAIHQAGIQLAVQQAQQQGLQMEMQQTLMGLQPPQAPPQGVTMTVSPGVQDLHVGLQQQQGLSMPTPQQIVSAQHEELQQMAVRQEMIAQAHEAQAQQQGLLNLQGVSLQAATLAAVAPLQRMSPSLPTMSALHLAPKELLQQQVATQQEELQMTLQQAPPTTSPRSLLAALPSGSANTTAQGGGAGLGDEGKKADLMQEAISAAARGSTQKLNELIEAEAQKQQQQQALAMAQAAEQHELQQQHEVNQAHLQAAHQAQQVELSQMHSGGVAPGVMLVEGGSQNTLQEGFAEPQPFGAPRGGPFFATLPPPAGLVGSDGGPAGSMSGQVVGPPLPVGALSGGQLGHGDLGRGQQLSPRGGPQPLRTLSRQHLQELAAAGMGPALNVGGGVNSVGGQLVMLQNVDDGAMQAERGHQEVMVAHQLHPQQSVANMVAGPPQQSDGGQHPQALGGMYGEPDTLTQASLVGHSLGHANEHPNS